MDRAIPASYGKGEHIDRHLGLRDTDILTGMQGNDVYMMERLFHAYFPILVRFAQSHLRAQDAAEEVVAELFCWLWEHRETWQPKGSIESYLFGATWNRVLNVVRGERRAAKWTDQLASEDQLPAFGTYDPGAESRITAGDQVVFVQQMLDTLPERTRLILTLRWHNDLTFDEIASIVGLSPDAVKKVHRRALDTLRRMLPDDFL